MSMVVVDPSTFPIKAIDPSGIPQYQGGQATATRTFAVRCHQAQELGLRAIGKFYKLAEFETPELPAEFPAELIDRVHFAPQQMRLVASAFEIQPFSPCCFNNDKVDDSGEDPVLVDQCIESLIAPGTLERYYKSDPDPPDGLGGPGIDLDVECMCKVTLSYIEKPWDCTYLDLEDTEAEGEEFASLILQNTALAVERSSSYEMYTVPNRNLVWADVADGSDRMVRGDSYGTVIIPTADITITWFNVPVKHLCKVETHLAKFRGTVNKNAFDLLTKCACASPYTCEQPPEPDPGDPPPETPDPNAASTDCSYEAETVLFLDWQEEPNARTRAFAPMDTTKLTLRFKQKRIPINAGENGAGVTKVVGHNHLLCDRETEPPNGDTIWQRVKAKNGSAEVDLFLQTDWKYLLRPTV